MRTLAEWLARLAAFCAAMAFFRWGYVIYTSYLDRFSVTFEREWGAWAQWTALFAMAGFVFGIACMTARPARYRLRVPLAVTLPALVLLGHFVLMIENGGPSRTALPWILDHFMFYMDEQGQAVLAVVAGFGLAAGLQPEGRPQEPAAQS